MKYIIVAVAGLLTIGFFAHAQQPSFTTDTADVTHPRLLDCTPSGGRAPRISAVGTIVSDDGQT